MIWRCILISNININDQFNYLYYNINTNKNEYLINKNIIVINSINRMDLNSIEYYDIIQKYQYNFYNKQKGIFLYSFSLNPLDLQPSGSLNFSKIDDAYIQLNINNIVSYQNPINIQAYAIQYNILKIANGIGGLIFDT